MTREEARAAIIAGEYEDVLNAVERGEKTERVVAVVKEWIDGVPNDWGRAADDLAETLNSAEEEKP